jgi:3-hydroxybutyryl-CoA dehydrogenase
MNRTTIRTVGIVGAGTMGSRIAFRCALQSITVLLYDTAVQSLERAQQMHTKWLDERISDGRLSKQAAREIAERVRTSTSLPDCVSAVDLVIETVPERINLKRQVFTQIDRFAHESTLVATNSSSIPCSKLSEVTGRAGKIFNINFSDPSDDQDKLVELMRGTNTSIETIRAAEDFVRSLNMVPVVTKKEIMGFSFNRIWRAVKREALHLVNDGYTDFEDIDRAWMLEFHTPYGPFGLMDKVGLDVIHDIEMSYYLESGNDTDRPPAMLREMVENGFVGVKSGRGFYNYPNPAYLQTDWLYKRKNKLNRTRLS